MCLFKSYTSWHLNLQKLHTLSASQDLPVQLGLDAKIRLLLDSISIWLSNLAMENQHFLIGKSWNNIHGPFSMAMLNNQRVCLSVQMRPVLLSMVPPFPKTQVFLAVDFKQITVTYYQSPINYSIPHTWLTIHWIPICSIFATYTILKA